MPLPAEGSVEAQAKINLRLRVLAREASGYHRIETIFQRIDLADTVRVRLTDGTRSIDCRGADVGPAERNLAWRAAVAYADATGWPSGFAIEIEKRIPAGGGLGGGSADAGAVLRILEAMSPRPIGSGVLEIAAAIGSDVPFLTAEHPLAIGTGRGEQLVPVKPMDPAAAVLLFPDFGIPTADAYGWLAGDRGDRIPPSIPMAPATLTRWKHLVGLAVNDLEPPVVARHPLIGELIRSLDAADARIAMMSGSGSTVFGLFWPDPPRYPIDPLGARMVLTRTSDTVAPVILSG